MKIKKYSLVLFLVICLIINLFVFRLEVFADVPAARKVQSFNASFTQLPWTYYGVTKYYKVEDSTGIPSSTALAPNYFYSVDNETFQVVNGFQLFATIVNKGLGLILKDSFLSTLYSEYNEDLASQVGINDLFIRGALFDNNDNFLGYCLGDLTGLYYASQPITNGNIDIPSDDVNNVYNFYQYYILENPQTPDYFVFNGAIPSNVFIANYRTDYLNAITHVQNFYNSVSESPLVQCLVYNGQYAFYYGYYNVCYEFDNECYGIADYETSYNNFCTAFNITDSLDYTALIAATSNGFGYTVYKNGQTATSVKHTFSSNGDSTTTNSNAVSAQFGASGFSNMNTFPIGSSNFTIYKNVSVYTSINVTNTYSPNSFNTNSFNDYSVNNDNSVSYSPTSINNAVTNNSNIYNESVSNFNQNIDNGVIHQDTINSNNQTIINNYYSDNSGGGGDNPDNPDSPLDWSDLIELLKNLLEAIGAVIVGIFEGLISMITQVLEAIANIVSSLGGFTDFLSALFGFLPSPVPEVLAAGFSLCVLCAVIKFLRG